MNRPFLKIIAAGLIDVPELTGLPPFTTPIRAFILADDERFRLALAEIANVRTELVADDISGYTIERDGTMLVFFARANVAEPASALLGYSHELAHLAVREATQRRALPQWFNEGYASWIAGLALARHHPTEAALQRLGWVRELSRGPFHQRTPGAFLLGPVGPKEKLTLSKNVRQRAPRQISCLFHDDSSRLPEREGSFHRKPIDIQGTAATTIRPIISAAR